MQRPQRIFALLFLTGFLLLGFSPFVFAQQTELEYPQVTGAESPNTTRELPKVIKYLFNLGLAISGFIAFGSFVYGGIRYLFSAGNPGALGDAKDQIIASLLGIVVLFGSYMLLTTINPQLVVLELPKTGASRGGVILYAQQGCPSLDNLKEEEEYTRVKGNLSILPPPFTKPNTGAVTLGDKPIKSIKFLSSSNEVGVALYSNIDYKPSQDVWNSNKYGEEINPLGADSGCISGDKLNIGGAVSGEIKAQSVTLTWRSPGIYLFAGEKCDGEARLFVGNTSSFGDFDNKARSLMIIPTLEKVPVPGPALPGQPQPYISQVKEKLGAVLYENANFKDHAAVFLGGDIPKFGDPDYDAKLKPSCIPFTTFNSCSITTIAEPYCQKPIGTSVSSLRVFNQYIPFTIQGGQTVASPKPAGQGVVVWSNYQFNEQDSPGNPNVHCGFINWDNTGDQPNKGLQSGKPLWVDGGIKNFNGGGNEIFYGGTSHESKENCTDVFKKGNPSMVSSISVDGNYIGILFNQDGKGEVFLAPGDIRLKDNHIGDDAAKFLLVIPLPSN